MRERAPQPGVAQRALARLRSLLGGPPSSQRPQAPHTSREPRTGANRRLLLTGAAGSVATLVRPALAARFAELRLTDRRTVVPAADSERFVMARLEKPAELARAARDIDAIVHLGGVSKEADFDALLAANVQGTINVFEAARNAGIRRVVLASTMHVLGFYGREEPVDEDSPLRPDSRYAVSKVAAEAVARLHAEKYGLQVACLRIGHATADRADAEPGNWIGADDLVSLICIGLDHPDIGFEIFHAVTHYSGMSVSDGRAERRFGHRWTQPGGERETELAEARRRYGQDPVAARARGGVFASADRIALASGAQPDSAIPKE